MRIEIILALTVVAMAACSSSDTLQPDVPALLTNPGTESRTEIEQIVSAALDGASVTIATEALTENSTLIIERGMHRSVDRQPELGRNLGRPDHFQLVQDGPQCFLVHEETGLRWMLTRVECRPE